MTLELDGRKLKSLREALVEAYPSYQALEMMVRDQLDEPLKVIVSPEQGLGEVAFELIGWAISKGRIEELVVAARKSNPTNRALIECVRELGLAVIIETGPVDSGGDVAPVERLAAREPEIRQSVLGVGPIFVAAARRIDVLSSYKRLHDLFQQLEDGCRVVIDGQKRLQGDATAWEGISAQEPEIQEIIDKLLEEVEQASFGDEEVGWVEKLESTRKTLAEALDRYELKALARASRELGRLLGTEPTRINTLLFATAKALSLSDLVEALRSVVEEVSAVGLEDETSRSFGESVGRLSGVQETMSLLVREHNAWQKLDDELRRVEADIGRDNEDLVYAWPELESMTLELCGERTERWAVNLRVRLTELGQELDAEGGALRSRFLRLRSQVTRRFNQVDHDLLEQCDVLKLERDHLSRLLGQETS